MQHRQYLTEYPAGESRAVHVDTKNQRLLALSCYRSVLGSLRNQPYSTPVWYIATSVRVTYSTFEQSCPTATCSSYPHITYLHSPLLTRKYTNFPGPTQPWNCEPLSPLALQQMSRLCSLSFLIDWSRASLPVTGVQQPDTTVHVQDVAPSLSTYNYLPWVGLA